MDIKTLLAKRSGRLDLDAVQAEVSIPGLQITGRLGGTDRGQVYAAIWEPSSGETSAFLAVKIMANVDVKQCEDRVQSLVRAVKGNAISGVLLPEHHGVTQAGAFYCTTELFQHDLGDLPETLRARRVSILSDVMRTIRSLHRCGFAHGNLKPSNVLVMRSATGCRVALLDPDLTSTPLPSVDMRAWHELVARAHPEGIPPQLANADHLFTATPATTQTLLGQQGPALDSKAMAKALTEHGFEVLGLLGEGASAAVYRVRKDGSEVAVKLFRGTDGAERIARTRQILDRLRSFSNAPFVVPEDIGQLATGEFFYTMEAFPNTLRSAVRSLDLLDLLDALGEVSRALGQLHRLEIAHRDLKPTNILLKDVDSPLGRQRKIVVADFGLAERILPESAPQPGPVIGTPGYRPPEAAVGVATAAWDIWSWGATALSVLSQRLLGGRRSLSPIHDRLTLDRHFTEVSGPVLALLQACLDPDPSRRPSADHITATLSAEVTGLRSAKGERQRVATTEEPEQLYRGLEPFAARHREHFYGRDQDLKQFLSLLDAHNLVVLLGPSGVGKSSFVQAAVLPHFESASDRGEAPYRVLRLSPGTNPFVSLAVALGDSSRAIEDVASALQTGGGEHLWQLVRASPRPRHLIVIDQFEELFTVAKESQRTLFVDVLDKMIAVAGDEAPVRVIASMREDLYGPLLSIDAFARPHGHGYYRLAPLGEAELRDTLEKPAEKYGYHWEKGLAATMVAQVAEEASALPLLQLTASELWRLRDPEHRLLRREVFERLGGVGGAIERHADKLLNNIVGDEGVWRGITCARASRRDRLRNVVRDLVLRLVNADNLTRRSMHARELLTQFSSSSEDRGLAERVLLRLVNGRLMTCRVSATRPADASSPMEDLLSPDSQVELVHESLITGWKSLRRWLDAEGPRKRLVEEVRSRAQEWEAAGHADGALWTDEHFEHQQRQIRHYDVSLTDSESEFWNACVRKQRARLRWRRWVLVMVALVAASLVGLGLLLLRSFHSAKLEAQRTARVSRARELALKAETLFDRDPAGSIALIKQSLDLADIDQGRDVARRFVDSWAGYRGTTQAAVKELVFRPDGRYLASSSGAGEVGLWPIEGGRPRLVVSPRFVDRLGFSSDGQWVTWVDLDGFGWRWRVAGGDPEPVGLAIAPSSTKKGQAVSAASPSPVGPKGQWKVANTESGELTLIPVSGRAPVILSHGFEKNAVLAFDPLGRWLASGVSSGRVRLWRMPTVSAAEAKKSLRDIEQLVTRVQTGIRSAPAHVRHVDPPQAWMTIPLVYVPGGQFAMGCPLGDRCSVTAPRPRQVDVPGFWMGQTEITQGQYEALMGRNPSPYWEQSFPVSNITWFEAMKFCDRLSRMTGLRFRLPTEDEWEFALRAGGADDLGPQTVCEHGNVADQSWAATQSGAQPENCDDYSMVMAPVKSYLPNRFGIYDLIGNVAELTMTDRMRANLSDPDARATAMAAATNIVPARGGSFDDGYVKPWQHEFVLTDAGEFRIGFRVVVDREEDEP